MAQRRYDRLITIQRKSVTQSSSGEEIATWADIAYQVPAIATPTKGTERVTASQKVAQQEVTFIIRFHAIPDASQPLGPEDRIIYPADNVAANTQAPADTLLYDIVSPDEVGRQVDLSIKTFRRADAS
jgi:head-tail adaptor